MQLAESLYVPRRITSNEVQELFGRLVTIQSQISPSITYFVTSRLSFPETLVLLRVWV
jgi:hypothetical protein